MKGTHFDFKKIFLISYFLEKRNFYSKKLIRILFSVPDQSLLNFLIVLNPEGFFGMISENFVENLLKSDVKKIKEKILNFNLVEDLDLKRLEKKDIEFVKNLFEKEFFGLVLFYENYLVFDLPISMENMEFFKKNSHKKIYRYKNKVDIDGDIFSIKDLIETDCLTDPRLEKEYRIEKILLSADKK